MSSGGIQTEEEVTVFVGMRSTAKVGVQQGGQLQE